MEEKSIAWMMHSIWTQQSNSDSQTQQEFWPSHSTLWFFWSCIWAFHVKRIRQIGLRGPGPLWDLLQWLALRPRRWLCRVCRGAGWHGGQERWIVLQGPCWTSSCRHLEIREMKNKICRYPSGPNLTLPGMPFFGNQRGGSKPIEFGMMFCPSTAPSVQDSPAWLNRAGLTAYQAIFTGAGRDFTGAELGKLGAGQKLLVLGGAAATGTIAT